jgi:transcriptional regulator with XRE-family HTH domain
MARLHAIGMKEDLRARFGQIIVSGRQSLGWTQRRLAVEAGVSQSAVARAECGRGGSIEAIARLLRAVGGSVQVRPAIAMGSQGSSDLVHRAGVACLGRLLARSGMPIATEQPVGDGRIRGWIDLLGFDSRCERLHVIEFKSELGDLGEVRRQIEFYARTCIGAAHALGWRPKEILVSLVALATEDSDLFVRANRADLSSAFQMRGHDAVRALLDGGPMTGRALLALDPLRSGRRALTSFLVDGRKRPFDHVHASDVRRTLDLRRRHTRRDA